MKQRTEITNDKRIEEENMLCRPHIVGKRQGNYADDD
jgi:hypothetical protein